MQSEATHGDVVLPDARSNASSTLQAHFGYLGGGELYRASSRLRHAAQSLRRNRESPSLYRSDGQGAHHVCDTSAANFIEDLDTHIRQTKATIAFDAVGDGFSLTS